MHLLFQKKMFYEYLYLAFIGTDNVKTQGVLKDKNASLIKNFQPIAEKITSTLLLCQKSCFHVVCTASYTWCLKNQQLWSIKRVLLTAAASYKHGGCQEIRWNFL
jgi:hypothetical protein